ncbi:MAG: BACON domain-containing protein [Betaproteobacteria bacterium]|nr:BACON domain-containing protein [Betaproteobacteria bacterium]
MANWNVVCTPRGGATCPVGLTPSLLRSGQKVAAWPPGTGLTLTATGTAPVAATGVEPTLIFAASVSSASGAPDPTPANDTPPSAKTVVTTPAVCNFVTNPASLSLGPDAQPVLVSLVSGSGCNWTAQSNDAWLVVTPAGGSGDADLTITPQGNTSPSERTGRVTVNGKTVLVAQAGAPPPPPGRDPCASMRLQREGDQIPKWGLTGVTWFTVYAEQECTWVTPATVDWISVETGGGGTGNGAVAYMAKPNSRNGRTLRSHHGRHQVIHRQAAWRRRRFQRYERWRRR